MEINLKETPLSEIDLTKIDYEKSYVWYKGKKDFIKNIVIYDREQYKVIISEGQYYFQNNGSHSYNPYSCTLHLFYKEVRDCSTCLNRIKTSIGFMCDADRCVNRSGWQPKKSVTEVAESNSCPDCNHWYLSSSTYPCCLCKDGDHFIQYETPNPHPIIIEYEDLGNTVKILKIEGVMTCNEIKKHAGVKIYDEYLATSPCIAVSDVDGGMYYHFSTDIVQTVQNGEVISKEEFNTLVETMKLSAKRLASLIKKPEIKRIEI